jgi:hypothetical protein
MTNVSGLLVCPIFRVLDPEDEKTGNNPEYFKLRYNLLVCWFLSFLLGRLSLEDGTDTLFQNVGKQLPHHGA